MRVSVSLKIKMTVAVAMIVAVILAVTGIVLQRSLEAGLRLQVEAQQFALAGEHAARLDAEFSGLRELVAAAANQLPVDALDDPELLQRLLDERLGILTRTVFDNGIFLLSVEGRLLAETPYRPGRRGRDYSHREYFRRTVETGRAVISDPYRSSQPHNHPAVNFTAPIRHPDGRLVAVLAGSIDLTRDNLLGRFGRSRFGQGGYLYLFSVRRLMIMHPDPARIMQHDLPPGGNRLLDRAVAGFEGTGETVNTRGVAMLTSFRRLQNVDWIVGANLPLAEAYAPLREMRNRLCAGLGAMLFCSVLATWFSMRYLTAPLLALIEHVQQLATSPETPASLPVTTRDEIGLLGSTFNDLLAEIAQQKLLQQAQLQLLQTLIDTLPHPIYYKDPDGHLRGCNRAFEKLYDLPREALLGRSEIEIVGGQAELSHRADLDLMRQTEAPFQIFEDSLTYADGSTHEVLHYKSVYYGVDQVPAGMVGTILDITQRKSFEKALAEARDFSENLLQNSAVPCFVIDSGHTVLSWTRACEELTGIPGGDVVGTDEHWRAFYAAPRPCLADLIVDGNFEQLAGWYELFNPSPLISGGLQAGAWFPCIGGKRRYLLFEAAPIRDRDGRIVAAIETLTDLTVLKQVEQALRKSEESYRSLIDRSPDAILVHCHGRVVFGNQAAARLFGWSLPEQMANAAVIGLFPQSWRDSVAERIRRAEEEGCEQPYIEEQIITLDGTIIDVETSSNPVSYHGEPAVQTILHDITERKALQERIWRQANYDPLTGIPNRLLFIDRLEQTLARAAREGYHVALLFIDLDRFKEVNDTLGHQAGDELLSQVAQRLSATLRKTDTLARLGGDEFTAIMPHVMEPPTMSVVARRLLDLLDKPFRLAAGEGHVTGSVGIAFFPEDGGDATTLMKAADTAMYRAKESGRNTFAFYSPGRTIREVHDAGCEDEV